jgi:hypothetical protein
MLDEAPLASPLSSGQMLPLNPPAARHDQGGIAPAPAIGPESIRLRRKPMASRKVAANGTLRLLRPDSPAAALGLAVSYLMTKPAFAKLAFGDFSRILVGQINRRHFCFAVDGAGSRAGLLGLGARQR